MKIAVVVFLILSIAVCQDITNKWEMLGFTFNSKIVGENLQIKVEGTHKGWVGIAFGKGMNKVDMNVVSFEQPNVIINDCWGVESGVVQIDKDESGAVNTELIGDKKYNDQTGAWSFTIQRPIKKTDSSLDSSIDITKGANSYFSVALGNDLEFAVDGSHGLTNIKEIQYYKEDSTVKKDDNTNTNSSQKLQNLIISTFMIICIFVF